MGGGRGGAVGVAVAAKTTAKAEAQIKTKYAPVSDAPPFAERM